MILDLSLSGDGANGAVDGLRSSWQNGGLGGSGLPAVQDVTITQRADDGEALQSVCMCAKCGGSFGHVCDGNAGGGGGGGSAGIIAGVVIGILVVAAVVVLVVLLVRRRRLLRGASRNGALVPLQTPSQMDLDERPSLLFGSKSSNQGEPRTLRGICAFTEAHLPILYVYHLFVFSSHRTGIHSSHAGCDAQAATLHPWHLYTASRATAATRSSFHDQTFTGKGELLLSLCFMCSPMMLIVGSLFLLCSLCVAPARAPVQIARSL